MNATPNPNDWHVKVFPRRAGDFGHLSLSSIQYTDSEAQRLQKDMAADIKRHIDNVAGTRVEYDSYVCECGNSYDTESEANECCDRTPDLIDSDPKPLEV